MCACVMVLTHYKLLSSFVQLTVVPVKTIRDPVSILMTVDFAYLSQIAAVGIKSFSGQILVSNLVTPQPAQGGAPFILHCPKLGTVVMIVPTN